MIAWSAAPEWAQYHTVNANGAAYWWESEPLWDGSRWSGLHHRPGHDRTQRCAVDGGTPGTLTKRPEQEGI